MNGQQDCISDLFTYSYVLHVGKYYSCTYDVIYDVISVHTWCKRGIKYMATADEMYEKRICDIKCNLKWKKTNIVSVLNDYYIEPSN